MNTTVFLLLFCILSGLCGYHSESLRSFQGFGGKQRGVYNYGQLNSRVNSQVFAKSETYSNAASGYGHAAVNGVVGNGPTNKDAWSTAQAYSNVGGGFGDMTQYTGKLSSNIKSQAESVPLASVQTNGGYNFGYANQDKKNVLKTKPFGNGFVPFLGLEHYGGQKAESHGNEFRSSQGRINQGKSNVIDSGQSHKSAYEFDRYSGNDHGSQLSNGFNLGIESSNGNTQFNNNRQDIAGHGQKHTHGRGESGSKYQAGIKSEGLKDQLVSKQSSGSEGSPITNSNTNGQESSKSSSFGASGHEGLQSSLSGALNLASQGLQASQKQPCGSCQKGSYALSNAKSHNGPAIAFSIGG